MSTSYYGDPPSPKEKPWWREFLQANFLIIVFLMLALVGMFATYLQFSPTPGDAAVIAEAIESSRLSAPLEKIVPAKPIRLRLKQVVGPIEIALIAGHRDNDSGAVCDDGLTEAEVNFRIAQQVQNNLQAVGVYTDIFAEFDPQLDGYSGTALVSIHADSCVYINDTATGFKIAGSSITDSERLLGCTQRAYRNATNLPYHANTITKHMTDYHAFRRIAPGTEAIIVETGFMNLDRELLTTNYQVPAQGITNGILCFLQEFET